MDPSTSTWIIGLLSLVVVVVVTLRQNFRGKTLPLPPGPRPDPIIGNLRHIPRENPHETFSEWGERYGMYSLA